MKKGKKEKIQGPSGLIHQMMRRMTSSPLRDAVYVRGMTANARPELKAIASQPFMKNGAVIITVKSEDVKKLDSNNTVGAAVRDFIFYGKRLEAFHVGPNSESVRTIPKEAESQEEILSRAAQVSNTANFGDINPMAAVDLIFPVETEMLNCIRCIAVPGQVVMEANSGFAPYILIGMKRDDEAELRWTRVSLQDERPAAIKWLKQIFQAMAPLVF